jgi:hypothetical protein
MFIFGVGFLQPRSQGLCSDAPPLGVYERACERGWVFSYISQNCALEKYFFNLLEHALACGGAPCAFAAKLDCAGNVKNSLAKPTWDERK